MAVYLHYEGKVPIKVSLFPYKVDKLVFFFRINIALYLFALHNVFVVCVS